MKKIMTIGLVAALASSGALADEGVVMVDQSSAGAASTTEVSVDAALVSAYVWRGQVYNNDVVVQSQVTVAHQGFSLNIWGNFDLGENNTGTEKSFSEIDFSLAYSLPVNMNQVAIDVGLINYNFPNNGDADSGPDTTELFVKATFLSWADQFIPSITGFGDVGGADGTYFLFDVAVPFEVSDYLAVEAGASAGWGNTSYNDKYWAKGKDEGWNDYNVYATASYELLENVTLAANLTYTWLDGRVRSHAEDADKYEASRKFWYGVSVAYDF